MTYTSSMARRQHLIVYLFWFFLIALLLSCALTTQQQTQRNQQRDQQQSKPQNNGQRQAQQRPQNGDQTIQVGDVQRTYYLHVPSSYDGTKPVPLVLVFHGGGGNGKGMEGFTGFSALADGKSFIVAYPDGIDHRWRSQPETTPEDQKVNDVGFVSTLIDHLSQTFNIDPKRVYAAGMSNGGVFAYRLACEISGKIAAIASVAGAMSANEASRCNPDQPVAIIAFHGTDDPIIHYQGGTVRSLSNSEDVLSVPDTIARWRRIDGCSATVQAEAVPHVNSADQTHVEREGPSNCEKGAPVELYTIAGGGHTWPGAFQYLPEGLIGKMNKDVSATELIWDFFMHHAKP